MRNQSNTHPLATTRFVYQNVGAEKSGENVDEQTSQSEPLSGAPEDVNKTKEQGGNMIGNAMESPMELADTDPQALYQKCLDADNLFLKAVDRNLYAGKEEEVEGKLIRAGEQVPVVKPGVEKYKTAYKAPNKPNVATPNVLVEYMANEVYKKLGTSFTDANGTTNEARGDKLYNYIFGSGDEKKESENAKKVAQWFSDAKNAIEQGIG